MSIMCKRYALFGGEHYYPREAWKDYISSFDSIEDAMAFDVVAWTNEEQEDFVDYRSCQWVQLVDLLSLSVVKAGDQDGSSIQWRDPSDLHGD